MLCPRVITAAGVLRLCLRSPAALAAANLFLRKQLALYQARHVTPQRATDATRCTLIWLSHGFDWRQALTVVQPEPFTRWHRQGCGLFRRGPSCPGRPRIPVEWQGLIRQMARDHLTWGQRRIANDLRLKLGLQVSPAHGPQVQAQASRSSSRPARAVPALAYSPAQSRAGPHHQWCGCGPYPRGPGLRCTPDTEPAGVVGWLCDEQRAGAPAVCSRGHGSAAASRVGTHRRGCAHRGCTPRGGAESADHGVAIHSWSLHRRPSHPGGHGRMVSCRCDPLRVEQGRSALIGHAALLPG
jgi:hypothetical protein